MVLALVPTDPSPAAALLSLLACLLGVALLCWPAARVAPLLQGWTSATGATGAVLTGAVAAGRGSPHWLGGAVLVVGVLVGAGLAGYVGVQLRRPALNGA